MTRPDKSIFKTLKYIDRVCLQCESYAKSIQTSSRGAVGLSLRDTDFLLTNTLYLTLKVIKKSLEI